MSESRIRHYGWTQAAYAEAENDARELGNGHEHNGIWHMVEVYDEGLHKLTGGEQGGEAYVVPDDELEAFREAHADELEVKVTAGWSDEEWDEILAGQS